MNYKLQVIIVLLASVQASRCDPTKQVDLANYSLKDSKADFDYLNRWLSKTVQSDDPEENLRQAVDKLHRIGGDQLGLERAIVIMKHLAQLDQCDDKSLELLSYVTGATGAVGGVIRRLDTVLRHFAKRAAAKCESYLDANLTKLSTDVQVNLEALEPTVGRVENLPLTLAKHDGRFNPNARDLASLITHLAEGDDKNVYQEERRKGEFVYYFGNLEYIYEKYLSKPCEEYIRQLKHTVELIEPVRLFTSNDRTPEEFLARRSRASQLALFRYQACEDIMRKSVDLGDIFDALTI